MNFQHHNYVIILSFFVVFAIFYVISRNSILFGETFSTYFFGQNCKNVEKIFKLSTAINTSAMRNGKVYFLFFLGFFDKKAPQNSFARQCVFSYNVFIYCRNRRTFFITNICFSPNVFYGKIATKHFPKILL